MGDNRVARSVLWNTENEDLELDGKITNWRSKDPIDLPQEREKLRALINTVMNLRVPQNAGKFIAWLNDWRFLKKCNT
jgi:hypothetical protein